MRGLARRCVSGFGAHDLLTFASAITFQILTALIPLAMFGLALFGLLGLGGVWHDHLGPEVRGAVSPSLYQVLDDVVRAGLESKRLFWLSAGLLLAVWEMSGAMRALMDALSRIYGDEDHRPRLRRYLISFGLSFGVGGGVLAAVATAQLATTLLDGPLAWLLRWPGTFLLLCTVVWLVMRYAPAEPEDSHWLTLGSSLCALAWLAASALFGFYFAHVADYDAIFSSLGAAFALLTYLYVSVIVLLGGAQVDALLRGRPVGPARVDYLRRRISGGRRRSRPAGETPRPAR